MTILEEYLKKATENNWQKNELENEIKRLIKIYNKKRNTNLIIYASNFDPNLPTILEQKDYYYLKDILDAVPKGENLDIYLETPGGSVTTAEEIVKYIHSEYNKISFVICGEAKSAGTIMAMSGNEILMTKTASLGPIDTQIPSSRGLISAYDYIEWFNTKRKEAEKENKLNPVDEIIISKIIPGELNSAINELKYAEELVKEWLYKYKFKDWNKTERRNVEVTNAMKKRKASSIAHKLSDHNKWKVHSRSLKIEDLEEIGLKITNLDNDEELGLIVYKINLVCRLLFNLTNTYKYFITERQCISLNAELNSENNQTNPNIPVFIDINHTCPNCHKKNIFYAKLVDDPNIDKENIKQGKLPLPKNNIHKCECGLEIDMQNIINDIENKFGQIII
ncbi:MAG: ATP-dependent Clp protease proteolytic subunit [Bacilli bacterium]|nr:ATP-dependent Clp protease proteolytic subunit [Bacilli bacterium]